MPLALLALAAGGFGIGLTEFVIAGLLPEVSTSLGVSEATAGGLISGYALAVAVGGILMTVALSRVDRKRALLALMIFFIAGNLLSALSPDYATMLAGRIIAALTHGAFFGIGSVVAASLVAPQKQSGAIALMFAGLTIANVLGVPLGTLLGQAAGWRSTFWAITLIGILALIGIAILVPRGVAAPQRNGGSILREFTIFRSGQVWASMLVTVLGYGGMFGAFTYIAFTLTEVSGFASSSVPWLLVLFGGGLFIGNILGGRAADKHVSLTLVVALSALTAVLVIFALTAQSKVATIVALVLMGALGFATVPALQTRIMRHATAAPTLGSGANIAAFNLGNAFGAWVGGVTITAGLGYTSPLWAGAAITLAGLAILLVADLAPGGELRRRVTAEVTPAAEPALATR